MRYIILALLPLLVFSYEGIWHYPTDTPYPQDESTAMTFGRGSAADRGRLYVLTRDGITKFRAYNHAGNPPSWITLTALPDIPDWGVSICAWYNDGYLPPQYKVFAIPYDRQPGGNKGHLYEYDIPTDAWRTLDTVPYNIQDHGHGLCLKPGNNDGIYINLYYWGEITGSYDAFFVYRRMVPPSGPTGAIPIYNHWEQLASKYHGDGADIAYWPGTYPNPQMIYALRGGNSNAFYAYDIRNNIWTNRHDASHDVVSGGSLAGDGVLGQFKWQSNTENLYAFSKNSSSHAYFDKYTPSLNDWDYGPDPAEPVYLIDKGADLHFGYWDSSGVQRRGIWATFGGNLTKVGFYEPPVQEGGAQSMTSQPLPEQLRITQKSRNQISINFTSILKTDTRFKIYDASGRMARQFSIIGGKQEYSLDCSNMPSGIYYYRLVIENNEFKGKLVKN
jgi:hypothetical protein